MTFRDQKDETDIRDVMQFLPGGRTEFVFAGRGGDLVEFWHEKYCLDSSFRRSRVCGGLRG